MLLLAAALSLVIGVVLGMLGGGGAILTLPMLVYVVHVEAKTAIATSLFVVGATSAVSAIMHARSGAVQWRTGTLFGAAAMAGAFAGGRVAQFVAGDTLLVVFALLMVASAIAMLRPSKNAGTASSVKIGRALLLGVVVGLVSGLVGAGGGFLIVPALTLLGGLAIRQAIGTSLFVIALQSFAGFAGHLGHVQLDWTLVAAITAACVAGAAAGASIGRKVSAAALRKGFAWLVLAMGLFMFAKELSPAIAIGAGAVALVVLFLVTRKPQACTTSHPSPRS
jgi:uncharacterized protein